MSERHLLGSEKKQENGNAWSKTKKESWRTQLFPGDEELHLDRHGEPFELQTLLLAAQHSCFYLTQISKIKWLTKIRFNGAEATKSEMMSVQEAVGLIAALVSTMAAAELSNVMECHYAEHEWLCETHFLFSGVAVWLTLTSVVISILNFVYLGALGTPGVTNHVNFFILTLDFFPPVLLMVGVALYFFGIICRIANTQMASNFTPVVLIVNIAVLSGVIVYMVIVLAYYNEYNKNVCRSYLVKPTVFPVAETAADQLDSAPKQPRSTHAESTYRD